MCNKLHYNIFYFIAVEYTLFTNSILMYVQLNMYTCMNEHLQKNKLGRTLIRISVSLADPGGAAGAPPNMINFFHFHIRFHQKVYASEVGAPPTGRRPPTGNPGSATVYVSFMQIELPKNSALREFYSRLGYI